MAPHFKREGTVSIAAGAVSPAWPTHVAGDIGILIAGANWGTTGSPTDLDLSVPAGFTLIGTLVQNTGVLGANAGTQLGLYWCRATSGAMTAPTIEGDDYTIARIITFGNCKATGSPVNGTPVSENSVQTGETSHSAPGMTTTLDDCLVVLAAAGHADAATLGASAWANNDLEGLLEVTDASTTTSTGGGITMATGIREEAGALGSTTLTTSTAEVMAFLTFALEPASIVDEVAPEITNFVPDTDTSIRTETVLQFDITDETGLALVALLASMEIDGAEVVEVIHDGDTFRGNYQGSSNTRTAISGGYRYTVKRDGGWPIEDGEVVGINIEFLALDTSGNIGEIV
jgi:hypothetical protein